MLKRMALKILQKGALFLAMFSTASKVSNFHWENVSFAAAVVVAADDAKFQ